MGKENEAQEQQEHQEHAQQQQPEFAEVVNIRRAMLQVSLSNAEFPNVQKCCFIFSLKYGLISWLSFETIIWLALFFTTFYFEIVLLHEVDLMDLSDTMEQWHFKLIFGNRMERIDHAIRTYVVLIYLILALLFLLYTVFCIVLIFGIYLRKLCFFIPYITLDIIFFLLAFISCIVGLIISNDHLFRLCLIFLIIKTYVELCVVSIFMKIRSDNSIISTQPAPSIGFVFQDNQATAV